MFSMMEETTYLKLPSAKTFGGDEYVSEDGRKDYTMTLQITKENGKLKIKKLRQQLKVFRNLKDLENMLKVIV